MSAGLPCVAASVVVGYGSAMPTTTLCRKCATEDFEPHEAGSTLCTLCARFDTLSANARKVRAGGSAPGIDLTREQFVAWGLAAERVCRYCAIPEHLIEHLGILTQVGHRLKRLGIDRADNDGGYDPANLRWCCFACNKAKSNTFTESEMQLLGPGVAAVWRERLAAQGNADAWAA
jgi:hypothetical protein